MVHSAKNYLICGASRGLGKAIVQSLDQPQNTLYGVCRRAPTDLSHVNWIETDLSNTDNAVHSIIDHLGTTHIDVFIYNVGIWESTAFTENYDFEKISSLEINQMISTNITTCIQLLQAVLPHLRRSEHAKVILIGSTWGVANHNGQEVVFSATKFALSGIVQSLREILRKDLIGVSLLNLGYLATEYTLATPIETVLEETDYALIPLNDVIQAIQFILSTSKGTCVKEILMPAMKDKNV